VKRKSGEPFDRSDLLLGCLARPQRPSDEQVPSRSPGGPATLTAIWHTCIVRDGKVLTRDWCVHTHSAGQTAFRNQSRSINSYYACLGQPKHLGVSRIGIDLRAPDWPCQAISPLTGRPTRYHSDPRLPTSEGHHNRRYPLLRVARSRPLSKRVLIAMLRADSASIG